MHAFEKPQTREQIIEQQKAKLGRVLSQAQPGLAVEIIRYGKNSRNIVSQTFTGGDLEVFKLMVTRYFNDSCQKLKEDQRLRIQLIRVRPGQKDHG
jgi:hypothetical protein